MKKAILLATATALASAGAVADKAQKSQAPKIQEEAGTAQSAMAMGIRNVSKSMLNQGKKALDADGVKALIDISDSYSALERKDFDTAIKKIDEADSLVSKILKKKDVPPVVPVDARIEVYHFSGNVDAAEKMRRLGMVLLDHHKVQDARILLSGMRDEIDLVTAGIPLADFPDILSKAKTLVHEKKIQEAKQMIGILMGRLVIVRAVAPIGVIEAEFLVSEAMKNAHNNKNKKLALEELKKARESLELSKSLGYVSTSSTTYKELIKDIKNIEKEVKGPNMAEALFEKLKKKLAEFREKSVHTAKKSK